MKRRRSPGERKSRQEIRILMSPIHPPSCLSPSLTSNVSAARHRRRVAHPLLEILPRVLSYASETRRGASRGRLENLYGWIMLRQRTTVGVILARSLVPGARRVEVAAHEFGAGIVIVAAGGGDQIGESRRVSTATGTAIGTPRARARAATEAS
jgi:hypothetical protein